MSEAISKFKQNLDADKYDGITGARRAIGKFQGVSDEERAKLHALANKKFGAEPKDTKEKPKRIAKPTKEAGAAKKAKSNAVAEPEPQRRTRKPAAASNKEAKALQTANTADEQLDLLEKAIKNLKDIGDNGVDVKAELEKAKAGISIVLDTVNQSSAGIAPASPAMSMGAPQRPVNGMAALANS